MGELQERVMRNAQGQLVKTTVPTTSQLAGEQGLTAPPTTPIGVAALGGTPKQQDMAGSQSQKTNALRQAADSQTTLAQVQADKRYTAAPPTELIEKQKKLAAGLGDTKARVQTLVETAMSNAVADAGKQTIDTASISTDQNVQNAYNAALSAIGTPDMMARLNDLSKVTGNTDLVALAADLDNRAKQQGITTAGKAVADTISNTVTVEQLLPELKTNATELSELLGIPEADVRKMNIAQLSDAIDNISTQSEQTEKLASSELLGTAERAAYREQGRELSASGLRSTEADLDRLASDVSGGDIITFGGRTGRWEELLSDETISKIVADYLELDPNSPEAKRFAADPKNAKLLEFINKHRAALTDISTKFTEAAKENVAIQEANKQLASPVPGVTFSDTLMREFFPDWDPSKRDTARREPTGFLRVLQDSSIPQEERTNWARSLSDLKQRYPNIPIDVQKLDANTARALFSRNTNGIIPAETLATAMDYRNTVENGTIDQVISSLFDGAVSGVDEAQKLLDSDKQRKRLGLPPEYSILDANKDGKVDDIQQLRRWALNRMASVDTIGEVVDSGKLNPPAQKKSLTDSQQRVYDDLKANGLTGLAGIKELVNRTSDIGKLQDIVASGTATQAANLKIHDLQELEKLYAEEKQLGETSDTISGLFGGQGGEITKKRRDRITELEKKHKLPFTVRSAIDAAKPKFPGSDLSQEEQDKLTNYTGAAVL